MRVLFFDHSVSFLLSFSVHFSDWSTLSNLRLWDGLLSETDRILILGATNRITDIDPAFIRRMPKRFQLPFPDVTQREKILTLVSLFLTLSILHSFSDCSCLNFIRSLHLRTLAADFRLRTLTSLYYPPRAVRSQTVHIDRCFKTSPSHPISHFGNSQNTLRDSQVRI